MSFRGRLVGAVSLVTVMTLGGAFAAVSFVVNGEQERQLDDALRAEAREEAAEVAQGGVFAISDRPGPAANDVGPLPKYAAIYGPSGAVLASTATFHGRPPPLGGLPHAPGQCFDFRFGAVHLRGSFAAVPGNAGTRLLLAAPRTDLDGDEAFLARAMSVVFLVAVGWSVAVATWAVRRLTRDHQRIAAVARRVAAGDLDARIESRSRDP